MNAILHADMRQEIEGESHIAGPGMGDFHLAEFGEDRCHEGMQTWCRGFRRIRAKARAPTPENTIAIRRRPKIIQHTLGIADHASAREKPIHGLCGQFLGCDDIGRHRNHAPREPGHGALPISPARIAIGGDQHRIGAYFSATSCNKKAAAFCPNTTNPCLINKLGARAFRCHGQAARIFAGMNATRGRCLHAPMVMAGPQRFLLA